MGERVTEKLALLRDCVAAGLSSDEAMRLSAEILNDVGLTVDSCHPGAAIACAYEHGAVWVRCATCRRPILSLTVTL